MSETDIKLARKVLTPVIDCHAEVFKIGKMSNRDRLINWAMYHMGSALDEIERLRARVTRLQEQVDETCERCQERCEHRTEQAQ